MPVKSSPDDDKTIAIPSGCYCDERQGAPHPAHAGGRKWPEELDGLFAQDPQDHGDHG